MDRVLETACNALPAVLPDDMPSYSILFVAFHVSADAKSKFRSDLKEIGVEIPDVSVMLRKEEDVAKGIAELKLACQQNRNRGVPAHIRYVCTHSHFCLHVS